jgi:UDP-galactopyranose mutase
MIEGLDIVYYGPEPWVGMWRNRHRLLSRLARANRVVYIEPRSYLRTVIGNWRAGRSRPAECGSNLQSEIGDRQSAIGHGLWLYRPPTYAAIGGGPLWRPVARVLRIGHLRRTLGRLGIRRPVVWLSHPSQADARDDLPARLRVYHVVDEYLGYAGVEGRQRAWLEAWENRIIAWADLIIAVTPELVAAKGRGDPKAHLLPNAADLAAFDAAIAAAILKDFADPSPRNPVCGYAGLISARLDLSALAEVAARRPGWSLVLVGEVASAGCEADLARLQVLPNVHLLGPRPAAEIPAIIAGWDLGLIPYRINEETRHASPLKLYEYLAAGLPVVSADVPAVRLFAHLIEIAAGAEEMLAAIERALAADGPQARRARREAVREHSWEARVEALSAILAEALEGDTVTR